MQIRSPQFRFDDVPRYWAAGNPLLTHYLNAFHVLIPEGERFFIRCVRPYLETLPQGTMRQRCQAFMGQEGWHQVAHRGFWSQLRRQGLPVDRFARIYQTLAFDLLEQRLARFLSDRQRLAVTAALEHYTAVMSSALFRSDFPVAHFHEEMDRLHRWHGAEELEHKAVAFDLHVSQGGSYVERVGAFLIASAAVAGWSGLGFATFCAGDPRLPRALRSGLLGPQRWPIRGRALLRLAVDLAAFLRPCFHPDQLDDPPAASAFLATFKGAA